MGVPRLDPGLCPCGCQPLPQLHRSCDLSGIKFWRVHCPKGYAGVFGFDTKDRAIRAWNELIVLPFKKVM